MQLICNYGSVYFESYVSIYVCLVYLYLPAVLFVKFRWLSPKMYIFFTRAGPLLLKGLWNTSTPPHL